MAALLGGMAAAAVPAGAATSQSLGANVLYSTATGCSTCRTLVLLNSDGTKPATGSSVSVDLSPGSNGFIAEVQDAGIAPSVLGGFSLGGTMSDLYGFDPTTSSWSCGTSIPAGDISLTSASALLSAHGLQATVQPIFNLAGSFTNLAAGVIAQLPGGAAPAAFTTSITDPAITSANQAVISGLAGVANLTGSVLSSLPISPTSGAGGAFTVPDNPPTGSNCALTAAEQAAQTKNSGPTSVSIMSGSVVPANITKLLGTLPASLEALEQAGIMTVAQADSLIAQQTNIALSTLQEASALGGLNLLGNPETIADQLASDIVVTLNSVLNAGTTLTGAYDADPVLKITDPTATPGSYKGVTTVTMLDTGTGV